MPAAGRREVTMTEDEWEEITGRIPWKFRLVTPVGGRGSNHLFLLEPVDLGQGCRLRKEGELLCAPHLTRHQTGRMNKIVKTARVVGYATPTCSACVDLLLKHYGRRNVT